MAEGKIKAAIAAYDAVMDDIGSCGDGGCIIKRPIGQHTNGGCRCYSDRMKAQRVMLAARRLRAALSEEVAV
jgi:hypothetical protein